MNRNCRLNKFLAKNQAKEASDQMKVRNHKEGEFREDNPKTNCPWSRAVKVCLKGAVKSLKPQMHRSKLKRKTSSKV